MSKQASTAGIHFLTGELPIEAKIHKDVFSVFYSVWRNPDIKIHSIVKVLLDCSSQESRTWSIYVQYLCKQYGLEDPVSCLRKDAPQKSVYKNNIDSRIKAFHEKELRNKSSMTYLNDSLHGLSGRHHPALSGLLTTEDVRKSRYHLKMLIDDLYTYQTKSDQMGGSPNCRLCPDRMAENTSHILAICSAYSDIRERKLEEYSYLCMESTSGVIFSETILNSETTCQFILDPSSFNLKSRIHMNDPLLGAFFKVSREMCFLMNKRRLKLLKQKEKEQKK